MVSVRAALLGALAVLVLGLPAGPAAAERVSGTDLPEGATVPTRIAGPDRVLTAIALARQTFEQADVAVLARADDFPDALTGAYLAGRHSAPILLTERDRMHPTIEDTLRDLGVGQVLILGGTSAVSTGIEARLRRGYTVTRIRGADRFETAAAVARSVGAVGHAPRLRGEGGGELTTAIVGTGLAFPDVLAAGPLAYAGAHPVLLAAGDSLPPSTEAAVRDLGIEQAVIVGGERAVGEPVAERLRELGVVVARVAGPTRTATAAAVADLTRRVRGWGHDRINLARGDDFADALALAPMAATTSSTVALTPTPFTVGAAAFEQIQDGCGLTDTLILAGGDAALTAETAREAALATVCADRAVPMSGRQELHEVDPSADGAAYLWVGSLCYALTVEAVEHPTAAHIHHGTMDADGPVAATLNTPGAGGFAAGCVRDGEVDETVVAGGTADALAAAVEAEPLAFYVNVHSDTEPDGAVRGNLGSLDFARQVTLTGQRVVDTSTGTFVEDPAAGTGTVDLRRVAADRLCAFVQISGTASPVTAAHIHRGRIDENGPAVVPLPVGAPRTSLSHLGCATVDEARLDGILADPGAFHVNVHTTARPGGALRGQVGADSFMIALGAAEVDDADPQTPRFGQGPTDAVGVAELYVGAEADGPRTTCIEAVFILPEGERLTPPEGADTSVHVQRGRVDENGPILFGWGEFDGQPAGEIPFVAGFSCGRASPTEAESVLTDPDGLYLNVHTQGFPAGALRGQLGPELSTLATGAQVPAGGHLSALATGSVWTGSAANPDVVCGQTLATGLDSELADVTLRRGAEGESGPAVASLAGSGAADVLEAAAFSCVTDADPDAVAALRADPSGHYLRVDTAARPTGALRGQLTRGDIASSRPPGLTSFGLP